jgi:hypothetical protein
VGVLIACIIVGFAAQVSRLLVEGGFAGLVWGEQLFDGRRYAVGGMVFGVEYSGRKNFGTELLYVSILHTETYDGFAEQAVELLEVVGRVWQWLQRVGSIPG